MATSCLERSGLKESAVYSLGKKSVSDKIPERQGRHMIITSFRTDVGNIIQPVEDVEGKYNGRLG